MSGWTLEEALAQGRGTERPFKCIDPDHDDSNASASVNVLKGLWYCYSCHAKGTVDSARIPTTQELLAMLEPEQACRELPQSFLNLYGGAGGYWLERFPAWVCWFQGFGENPWTGIPTYPVHTPGGRLAGVCERVAIPDGPKYKYPHGWSASRTLFGNRSMWPQSDVIVLTEGAADQAAVMEAGYMALATYGSGLHLPQKELVLQMQPQLVLCGYDMDEAGERASAMTHELLNEHCEVQRVLWPANDPAVVPPDGRSEAVLETVSLATYADWKSVAEAADVFVSHAVDIYERHSDD